MRKMQNYIVKDNRIFVGIEDSTKTWKLCVRCDRMIVHETCMPTEYDNLRNYLNNRRGNGEKGTNNKAELRTDTSLVDSMFLASYSS